MFLYQKVFDDLKNKIVNGEYHYGDLLPSEREIGEIYKVDRTTVRKSFQLLVDEDLVKKRAGKGTVVIYQSTKPTTTSTPNAKGSIAFLLPKSNINNDRISIPFYSELFFHVEQKCKKHGYSLIYSTLEETDTLSNFLANNQANIIGIMFISNISEKHIDCAIDLELPCVLLNGVSDKIPSIISDNFAGTYAACEHLISLGHKEIGVIKGISTYKTSTERMHGVVSAMKAHNLIFHEEFILGEESWEFEGGYQAASNLISSNKSIPSALIAFNDRLALGAMQAFQQAGFNVPDDISIIGYDNSEHAQYSMPKLSSVEINIPYIAKAAFANLLYQIQDNEIIPVKVLTPVSYIERDSVKNLI